MRPSVPAVVALLALSTIAGCTEEPNDPGGGARLAGSPDFITPQTWRVSPDQDRAMVWVHNEGSTDLKGSWNLTLEQGRPLPAGWTVAFQTPNFDLKPNGTKTTTSRGKGYPDWARTMVTIKIPSETAAGTHK